MIAPSALNRHVVARPESEPDVPALAGTMEDEERRAVIETALHELPAEQREIFVAHELEGRSFKEFAEEKGVNVNTLLSRKRYAVLQRREKLQRVHEECEEK